MKNKIRILLTALLATSLFLGSYDIAQADTITGDDNWQVEFTSNKEMTSNYSAEDFQDSFDYMQPGDVAQFKVTINNTYSTETDWYMSNKVIQSMEDNSKTAKSGAYAYKLYYYGPSGTAEMLYDSTKVGGEVGTKPGLHEATDNLGEYFYLDTLQTSGSGYVLLTVALDGETQGNDYQDTLAQLKLNFAVELPTAGEGKKGQPNIKTLYKQKVVKEKQPRYVKTGDESRLTGLYIAALVLAILCVITGVLGLRTRRKGGVA